MLTLTFSQKHWSCKENKQITSSEMTCTAQSIYFKSYNINSFNLIYHSIFQTKIESMHGRHVCLNK